MSVGAQSVLEPYALHVERALRAALPEEDGASPVLEAMRYSLRAPGKRLRPALCFASCRAVGAPEERADAAAAALELVHTYSLVHDDLPCMDDDDTRRGRPTCHVVHGEGLAVLAGDGLLTHAFEMLASDPHAEPDTRMRMVRDLAHAAGFRGMVGGQALDLAAEGKVVTATELRRIHARKTGALFEASCRLGAWAGGASEPTVDLLGRFGNRLGLAFQIADDVLDETGTEQALGKAAGKDRARGKATFPALFGLRESRRLLASAVREAEEVVAPLAHAGEPLAALARFVAERTR